MRYKNYPQEENKNKIIDTNGNLINHWKISNPWYTNQRDLMIFFGKGEEVVITQQFINNLTKVSQEKTLDLIDNISSNNYQLIMN